MFFNMFYKRIHFVAFIQTELLATKEQKRSSLNDSLSSRRKKEIATELLKFFTPCRQLIQMTRCRVRDLQKI